MRTELTLDCVDLDGTSAFWQRALGYVEAGSIEGRYVMLAGGPDPGEGPRRVSAARA